MKLFFCRFPLFLLCPLCLFCFYLFLLFCCNLLFDLLPKKEWKLLHPLSDSIL
ncbi:hypothetical protein EVA_13190 [gut metagenome]|uniref:Uncharacterized protein n=1 Tax=gut metagenome TaxID=749906 RepID=J9GH28_9ZZZZ